jgi:hypothetical protein
LARDLGIVAALVSDLQGKLALKSSPVVSRLNQRAKTLHIDKFVRGVAQERLRGLDRGPGRVD